MKKILGLLILLSFSTFALADQVAANCSANDSTSGSCWPNISQGNNTTIYAYFYCKVDPKATFAHFEDHNLLVSGFNKNGILEFGLPGSLPVSELNNLYFEAINDLQHDLPGKAIGFAADKNITCYNGQGGRTQMLGGFGIRKNS